MTPLIIFLKSNITLNSLVIAATGYLIVFTALVLLFWLFSMVPRLIELRKTKNRVREGKPPVIVEGDAISGEATAAIAMALHLYLDEIHDKESGVLTIKRISKTYSPWSSKIYAVRNQFNRL
jgi:glutaconyl-CoA/methylmalonyl-CoA decarboxylase subunit delta